MLATLLSRCARDHCLLALVGLLALAGCSRTHYRLQANRDVNRLIAEKGNSPAWALPGYNILMDPRSRFFDPTSADFPPMPQDDPASHQFMHCVACKKGWPCWHANGDWWGLENPRWGRLLKDYTDTAEDGSVKLSLDGAVKLARIHSQDYRLQIEELYLSALDVSTERFRFQLQFFGNNQTVFTHNGKLRSPAGERNTLQSTDTFQLQKKFLTGAELMVGLANSFVWQFAGPDTNNANSLLSFNLVQPLLRMGGRVIALEQLTIVERVLLANLRAFQRYRQGFYTNVAVGDSSGVSPPQRRGGFLGGTGLTGFSGQGSGGLGEVGQVTGFARPATSGGVGGAAGGAAGFAGGGAGLVGGFIGMLQQQQQIRNTQDSLSLQLRTLGLLEANLAAGLIDIAQVDQFRQNIETERANLLAAQVGLQSTLDNFKTTILGLPPDLAITLNDEMIQRFRLIDPRTTKLQNLLDDFVRTLGDLPGEPAHPDLVDAVDLLGKLRGRVKEQFNLADVDVKRLETSAEIRRKAMDAEQAQRFDRDRQGLLDNLAELAARFAKIDARYDSLQQALEQEQPAALTDSLVNLGTGLSVLTQELALVQARARLESITLDPINLNSRRALDIARANRLDWMNARAALVDTWRLIAFNANALKSNLDITLSGDLGTTGNNITKFNGQNGSLRAGVRFDAPFTRRLERNNYVQVLINYQQDRRRLILFQDGVNQTLRLRLRQMRQLSLNLEIQRRAVVIAVRRVDQTRENLNKPPEPVEPGAAASQLGPTSAGNLLTALSDLRNSQNNFMSVWLNYYAARMILMRELGLMELDSCGIWIDRPLDEADTLDAADCPPPPALPAEWLSEAGLEVKQLDELSIPAAGLEQLAAAAGDRDEAEGEQLDGPSEEREPSSDGDSTVPQSTQKATEQSQPAKSLQVSALAPSREPVRDNALEELPEPQSPEITARKQRMMMRR